MYKMYICYMYVVKQKIYVCSCELADAITPLEKNIE